MWYKFSEKKPKDGEYIVTYYGTSEILRGKYKASGAIESITDWDHNTYTLDDNWYWTYTHTHSFDVAWYKYEEKEPKDGSYIAIRHKDGWYEEGKYVRDMFVGATTSLYLGRSTYWCYLPKEFTKKKEMHIWLDFSGCMPKDCCITFKATKEAIKEGKEYINTVQTKIPVDDLIEGEYKLFVHAGNKKREITGDFNINQVIEEWDI